MRVVLTIILLFLANRSFAAESSLRPVAGDTDEDGTQKPVRGRNLSPTSSHVPSAKIDQAISDVQASVDSIKTALFLDSHTNIGRLAVIDEKLEKAKKLQDTIGNTVTASRGDQVSRGLSGSAEGLAAIVRDAMAYETDGCADEYKHNTVSGKCREHSGNIARDVFKILEGIAVVVGLKCAPCGAIAGPIISSVSMIIGMFTGDNGDEPLTLTGLKTAVEEIVNEALVLANTNEALYEGEGFKAEASARAHLLMRLSENYDSNNFNSSAVTNIAMMHIADPSYHFFGIKFMASLRARITELTTLQQSDKHNEDLNDKIAKLYQIHADVASKRYAIMFYLASLTLDMGDGVIASWISDNAKSTKDSDQTFNPWINETLQEGQEGRGQFVGYAEEYVGPEIEVFPVDPPITSPQHGAHETAEEVDEYSEDNIYAALRASPPDKMAWYNAYIGRLPTDRVLISCKHPDFNSGGTFGGVKINFYEDVGLSHENLIRNQGPGTDRGLIGTRTVKNPSCKKDNWVFSSPWDVTFKGKSVDWIKVSIDSDDAFFLEQIFLNGDNSWFSNDDSGNNRGWCLSTDAKDRFYKDYYENDWAPPVAGVWSAFAPPSSLPEKKRIYYSPGCFKELWFRVGDPHTAWTTRDAAKEVFGRDLWGLSGFTNSDFDEQLRGLAFKMLNVFDPLVN